MTHRPRTYLVHPAGAEPGPPPPAPRADDVLTATEARLDLSRVPLHRDAYGTYVAYRDGTPLDDEDVVRLYVHPHEGVRHPLTVVGDLGRDLTRDEAVELARALLVLAYHHDRAAATAAHRPGDRP